MEINGRTKVVGIIGYPVEHSFSPQMHNSAFAQLGINFAYVPFPVTPDNLYGAVSGIKCLGLAGANVTIPHKSSVIGFLDELTTEAKLIGAVNTIVNKGGVLTGYNTDASGFLKSLEEDAGVTPKGKNIFILGAGGAARAVAVQLALAGAAQIIFSSPVPGQPEPIKNVILNSSETLVGEIQWEKDKISHAVAQADILINATPLGMYPDFQEMPPLSFDSIGTETLICDLIYNPKETLLLKKARERGLRTLNGLGMLLYQGALAFELWTGLSAPTQVMRNALKRAL